MSRSSAPAVCVTTRRTISRNKQCLPFRHGAVSGSSEISDHNLHRRHIRGLANGNHCLVLIALSSALREDRKTIREFRCPPLRSLVLPVPSRHPPMTSRQTLCFISVLLSLAVVPLSLQQRIEPSGAQPNPRKYSNVAGQFGFLSGCRTERPCMTRITDSNAIDNANATTIDDVIELLAEHSLGAKSRRKGENK